MMSAHETEGGAAARGVCLIVYTTLYRDGGPQLEQAARTMAREKAEAGYDVRLVRVESKRDFVDAARGVALAELHFVGHSGMYGPMFRTTAMPEQFSPHEWRDLARGALRFADRGEAFFHACRTARWFAPFFARTFGVPAHGFHWYTSFSRDRARFRWPGPLWPSDAPLYLIGCEGRKSHGVAGSVRKYTGLARAEALKRFEPEPVEGDASYDEVAALYDDVFLDIRVRAPEWRWIDAHLEALTRQRAAAGLGPPRVLDLGCGNGALLRQMADRIALGRGVDASEGMLGRAARHANPPHLAYAHVDGPALPFEDDAFDVVVSLLSFRYLDWDPLMQEVLRVLAPGGRLWVVDMVTAPLTPADLPRFARDKARDALGLLTRPRYAKALRRLVRDPRWATMLRYNPIRAVHELVWYLESRFPGRRVELLAVGRHNRVLAFDSGPIDPDHWVAPQSYP